MYCILKWTRESLWPKGARMRPGSKSDFGVVRRVTLIFDLLTPKVDRFMYFLSASLYFSKRGAYWDRLCRDVVGRWLVVTRVHCGQTVHPRPIVTMGTPTPGIQWYKFRPPGLGWPLTGEWAPREALFVKLLWPLVRWDMVILRFTIWRPSAIFNLKRISIWSCGCHRVTNLHLCTKFRQNMAISRFSRWWISAIFSFRGPIMGSLESPCVTSDRSSVMM